MMRGLKIISWRRECNTFRPHFSLQGLTPEEVEFEMLNDRENANLALPMWYYKVLQGIQQLLTQCTYQQNLIEIVLAE